MADKDKAQKALEAYNDVFADIVNVLLFGGEQVIKENELVDATAKSFYKAGKHLHEQERDVAKYVNHSEIRIASYGIENQTDADKAMPLRVISYDGAAYREQLLKKKKSLVGTKYKSDKGNVKKDDKSGLEEKHDLSDGDIYYPVITLVLYFGYERHWDKSTHLMDCLNIPEELKKYVHDYPINLFEVAYLEESDVSKFGSDFRIVADYFVQMRKNKHYEPSKETIQHVHEVLQFMSAMTQDSRFEDYRNQLEADIEQGGIAMCNTFDEYEHRGIEKGRDCVNMLGKMLVEAGRIEDLARSFTDSEFQKQLMKELLPAEMVME